MNSHDLVGVGLRYPPQLFHVRSNELRPSLPKDAEHLGRFHPDLAILVVQELIEHWHAAFIDLGRVRGDVLRCPDEGEPDLRIFVGREAEHSLPIRLDHLKVDEARKSLTQRVRELSEIKEEIQSAQFLEMQALDMGGAAGIGHSDSNAKPTK